METGYVGILCVELHFPENGSLKGKRKHLLRLKAQLEHRMGASVAEVDHHDTWQRSTLAVALTAGSPGRCDEAADNVVRYLDARFPQGVRVERRVASWNDLESLR